MIIANPIYGTVFKYLLEDIEIARELLPTGSAQTKLERVLQVFSPDFLTADPHQLDFRGDINDPLVRKMVDRLGRAIASEEMRDKMDVEDEISRIFERQWQKISSEKDAIIAEERQKNEALQQQIEELKKQLNK